MARYTKHHYPKSECPSCGNKGTDYWCIIERKTLSEKPKLRDELCLKCYNNGAWRCHVCKRGCIAHEEYETKTEFQVEGIYVHQDGKKIRVCFCCANQMQ